jgi:hypothetical protein
LRLPKPIVAGEAVHVDGFDAVVAVIGARARTFSINAAPCRRSPKSRSSGSATALRRG